MQAAVQNNSVRLIAIDMDGTLLGEDARVSPRNAAALHAAEAAGIEVVVATGRRHSFAMRVLRPLGLRYDNVLISSNGTVTRTFGSLGTGSLDTTKPIASQLIASTHLSRDTALWLVNHLDEFRNALVLTFDRTGPDGEDANGSLVVEHLDQLNDSIERWITANRSYIAQVNPIELALADDADTPIQAMLCGTIERMARAESRLLQHPGVATSAHEPESSASCHQLTVHRTAYPARDLTILDILPANCSKGVALLSLAATRGIPPAQILAIGDNWNDTSMFEIAGSVVLMGNAPDDLKAIAHTRGWHIGLSNRADGVAEAIESVLPLVSEIK